MLEFYDSDMIAFSSDPLRTSHNGHLGTTSDKLIYVKNSDLTVYYTDVTVSPGTITDDILGEWGETGFGLKLLYGESRPTETEWDQVKNGESIDLPDVGTTDSADITNYYPLWVRVICPTKTPVQLKTSIYLRVESLKKQLGS